MRLRLHHAASISLIAIFLSGCAETPRVFRYDNVSPGTTWVWPAPPEQPRFGYVGELTGENNFRAEKLESRSTATKLLDWLTKTIRKCN